MKKVLAAAAVCLSFLAPSAQAALVDIDLPTGSYISNFAGTGLDVAWAAPCRAIDPSCGAIDLSFQSSFGWRLATAAEVALLTPILDAMDFVFAGANVPLGGSDPNGANFVFGSPGGAAACASPYFSPFHRHCDWGNAPGSGGGGPVPWGFGQPGEQGHAEAIAVRNSNRAPEPGVLSLMGLALLALGFTTRRRRG